MGPARDTSGRSHEFRRATSPADARRSPVADSAPAPAANSNADSAEAWTRLHTEAWVRQVYKLEELTMTETGPKQYKRTGKTADGKTVTFTLIEEQRRRSSASFRMTRARRER